MMFLMKILLQRMTLIPAIIEFDNYSYFKSKALESMKKEILFPIPFRIFFHVVAAFKNGADVSHICYIPTVKN